jgi:hypothetical protein
MKEDIRCKDDLTASRKLLMSSLGEIKGKLRGDGKCGSAQQSLLNINNVLKTRQNFQINTYYFPLNSNFGLI